MQALLGDDLVDELQFADRRARQREGVVVGLAHAAREFVEHVGQAHPTVEEIQELGRARVVGLPEVREVEQVGRELDVARIDAEAHRRVRRVGHVQVVRPGLGPVLPRVRAGVAGDAAVGPVGSRPLFVVHAQRVHVVGALVAEEFAEIEQPLRRVDQPVPVVVADLVAEMTHQRAVRLAHLGADLLAHHVLGLGGVQGDHAGLVAGDDGRSAGHVVEEVEGQAAGGIGVARDDRQPQHEQLRHQPSLGQLELVPQRAVALDRLVGNGARGAARQAEAVEQAVARAFGVVAGAGLRHHPVAARGRVEVRAAPPLAPAMVAMDHVQVRIGPIGVGRLQGHHAQPLGDVAQVRAARQALAVAQVDGTAALALVGPADGGRAQFDGERAAVLLAGLRHLGAGVDLGRDTAVVERWAGVGCEGVHGARNVGAGKRKCEAGILGASSCSPASQRPISS